MASSIDRGTGPALQMVHWRMLFALRFAESCFCGILGTNCTAIEKGGGIRMEAQAREPQMGLTFEKVWAMFQESDRQLDKLRESQQETDR